MLNGLKIGDVINERLILTEASVRQNVKKKDYLVATFSDGTDNISGNFWDWTGPAPELKKVYEVVATIGEYNGAKQLQNIGLMLSQNQSKVEFSCKFVDNPESIWEEIMGMINHISHPIIKWVCFKIYMDRKDEIMAASSGRSVHHVGVGGNIMHTWEVTCLSRSIAETMRNLNNLRINGDLVTAGALLHDIGKPDTYQDNESVIEMTAVGMLEDHVVAGIRIVSEYLAKYHTLYGYEWSVYHGEETASLLLNIIASHHGKVEMGVPVTPKFMEAYIVSYADNISTTLEILRMANIKAEDAGKQRTDRLYFCGNNEHMLQRTIAELLSVSD